MMIFLAILAFFVIFTIVVLNSTTENSENDEIMKKYNEIKKRNNENIASEKAYQGSILNNSLFDNANSNNNFFTSSSLDDSHCESSFSVNPASGLPMIGDSMIDVGGNTYGSSGNNDDI